jgi:hypothetical protein
MKAAVRRRGDAMTAQMVDAHGSVMRHVVVMHGEVHSN